VSASDLRRPGQVVWDNHACAPLRPGDTEFLPTLERYRAAGFTAVTLNVGFAEDPAEQQLAMLATFREWLGARPDQYALIATVDDVRRAAADGRLGVAFDIEGMALLEGQLPLMATLYAQGVRWMSITYNKNNAVGGGCQDEDGGLTAFGREVIAEAKRVGMAVCCSHTGHRTARDVMEMSENPVIFSHSNASAIHKHSRNIGDDLIVACARTGGVVGVNGIGHFLGANDNRVETLVRHLDHMVQLVGPAHVAIALDYVFDSSELDEYVMAHPELFPASEGYATGVRMVAPEALPEICDALVRLGYTDGDLEQILGGSLLRVAEQVWRPAH
jgi:membrane dipeptidase